jgi:hypothetical protein
MKNIHILPTDKPSRLIGSRVNLSLKEIPILGFDAFKTQHIYITNDEEIKEGEYCITKTNEVIKFKKSYTQGFLYKKIILTTDQDLIKDGVQEIDEEYLEWFVKNPSCEFVEVVSAKTIPALQLTGNGHCWWKIIIPKDEPKQETLEEASWKFNPLKKLDGEFLREAFIAGAKWQAERSYTELLEWLVSKDYLSDKIDVIKKEFEQFNK